MDRTPVYSKAAADILFAGLSANLSAKMRRGIIRSLSDFPDFDMISEEGLEREQVLSNPSIKFIRRKFQRQRWAQAAVNYSPFTGAAAGIGLIAAGAFLDMTPLLIGGVFLGLSAMTSGLFVEDISDIMEKRIKKKAALCRKAFE